MRILNLAVVGDPHGSWDRSDHELLAKLSPDALLVVGDLSDGQPRCQPVHTGHLKQA